MPTSRLYYRNLLTQQTFSAFNVAGGAVSMAPSVWSPFYDFSAGNATIAGAGVYTGTFEANYVIEVHSSSNGTFAGSRVRWSDTGGAEWNVQNILPVSGVPIALNNGLSFTLTASGVAPEFVLGDYWYARALRPYGIAKALDGSRNSEYRSGTTPASSTVRVGWDLSSAQPTLFVLDDHNIPSNAVTTLYAHSTLFTETGGFSRVCTWRANRIVEVFTSNAFRYYWVKVVMPASGQPADLRFSEIFLGTGATLSKTPSPRAGISDDLVFLKSIDVENLATRGPHPRVYAAASPQYTWWHVRKDAASDGGKLEAAFAYARTHSSHTMPPFYFLVLDDDPSTLDSYSWAGSGLQRRYAVADKWDYSVNWAQVIRTAAS